MTNIELHTLEAVRQAARQYIAPKEIDWEQRRYEIAKEVMPKMMGRVNEIEEELAAKINAENFQKVRDELVRKACSICICYADELIRQLKGGEQ